MRVTDIQIHTHTHTHTQTDYHMPSAYAHQSITNTINGTVMHVTSDALYQQLSQ